MGLDSVELVLEVEDNFGISITDQEAEGCATVGQLIGLVERKLRLQPKTFCVTSRSFYRIRRAMMACLGTDRGQINLDSRLAELLPRADIRPKQWRQLRNAGITLPRLGYTTMQIVGLVALGAILPALYGFVSKSYVPFVLGSMLLIPLAFRWGSGIARSLPTSTKTLRQLVLLQPLTAVDASLNTGISRPEVTEKIRYIISNQLGVPVEELADDVSFVKDLNMG